MGLLRRTVIRLASLALALVFVAACAPAAQPSPTLAPAKPAATIAPAPTTAPAAKPAEAAKPAAKAEPTPAAKAAATLTDAERQSVEQFYRGKTITITVGTTAGGGYDTYARLLGRHVGKFIPGQPNVIVQNESGGGGLVMMNMLYNSAAKDGTALGAPLPANLLSQLVGTKEAQFDSTRFGWIGSLNEDVWVFVARFDSPVKSLQQALTTPLRLAVSGASSPNAIHANAINEAVGTKFQLVSGYQGGAAMDLSVEQGETEGRSLTVATLVSVRKEWLERKPPLVNPIVQLGVRKHPRLPSDVALALDAAKTPDDRKLLEAVALPEAISRSYVAPPGIPAERLKALRIAFAEAAKSKDLLDEANKANLETTAYDGEKTESVVKQIFDTPAAIRERLAKVVGS